MQQPWWAYLTAVNLFSLSITDNTFMLLQSCQSWFGLPDYNPITVNASCLSPNNVGFVWFLLLGCCFVMFCVRLIWLHCVVYWTCGWLRMFWLWVSVWLSAHSGNGQCDKRIVKSFHCQPILNIACTLYIVRPSLHNICMLSQGPTVTSSVHNTLLANKVRGFPQSLSRSVGWVSYVFTDI